ncbi:hypothetical protein DPMN_099393 [Dreissena polymorpha]|uniref:Uncharacterized protein n=1 Tax=Dreissena polymorpha TaxID=45954 RepID=A0A9D4R774_DREPO|nr:hypothetical protein DPMN_099393 [Dreissena polymorpha]
MFNARQLHLIHISEPPDKSYRTLDYSKFQPNALSQQMIYLDCQSNMYLQKTWTQMQ